MADVITDAGLAINSNRVSGVGGSVPRFVGWGTGAGTAAKADTTLFSETGSRATGLVSRRTTTKTNDTMRVIAVLSAPSGMTITNAGLLDAAIGGNLYAKSNFVGQALQPGDAVMFTFDVVFGN